MFREVAVVLDKQGRTIYWHVPDGRDGGAIPDSRKFWVFLWDNMDRISGVAHTHPGGGIQGPSHTDYTTFFAIEKGLKDTLDWWVVSSEATVLFRFTTPPNHPNPEHRMIKVEPEPWWVPRLREVSNQNRIRLEVCDGHATTAT